MSNEPGATKSKLVGKKGVLYLGIAAIGLIFLITYMVCASIYDNKKTIALNKHKLTLEAWVNNTSNALSVWKESLNDQAKRISSSELYRLFAQDINSAGAEAANRINTLDSNPVEIDESIAHFVEQIPLMRSLMYDFMNYNGFTDARIVNAAGNTLLSALSRPTPVSEDQQKLVAESVKTGQALLGVVRPSAAGLVVDFVTPLRSTMGNESEVPVAGFMLTKPVTGEIAQFLARDRQQGSVFAPHIIQREGDKWYDVVVHHPKPLLVEKEAGPAEGESTLPYGERMGLDKRPVYSFGAPLNGIPWWLVLETPSTLIEEELSAIGWTTFGFGFLASAGMVLFLVLLWWMAIGREQQAIAQRFQNLYLLIERQKSLLQCVNVSLQVGLFLADDNGKIHMANRSFADIVQKDEDSVVQQNLNGVLDAQSAWKLVDAIREVIKANAPKTFEIELDHESETRLYRVTLYAFIDESTDTPMHGAVGTFQDITEFRRASEANKRQQTHMIEALVRAIEGVDPYLSGHSRKMGALGTLIGKHLQLGDKDIATLQNAAAFSQMGKLFVPRDILTKSGKLSDAELAELKKVPEYAYEVLRGINFGMPVPQAVYQMYERPDGKGYPQQLSGDGIAIHARILAVTNAFCAMVSPRSYRAGMSFADAVSRLKNDQGSFDPAVVEALAMVIMQPETAGLFASEATVSLEDKD